MMLGMIRRLRIVEMQCLLADKACFFAGACIASAFPTRHFTEFWVLSWVGSYCTVKELEFDCVRKGWTNLEHFPITCSQSYHLS